MMSHTVSHFVVLMIMILIKPEYDLQNLVFLLVIYSTHSFFREQRRLQILFTNVSCMVGT